MLGLDLGVFVRQLHHLLTIPGGRNIVGYHWTYQTHDDLARDVPLVVEVADPGTVSSRMLASRALLVTRRQQHGGQLYRLDYDLLNRLFDEVGEPLPDWLLDAQFDPPTLDGRQGGLVDVQEGRNPQIVKPRLLSLSISKIAKPLLSIIVKSLHPM